MLRALITAALGAALLFGASQARASDKYQKAHGLTIIAWAAKVDEDRFRSPRSFEDTVRWYEKLFQGNRKIKQYREVNLPQVKYVHFHNNDTSAAWEGMNIYQAGDKGEVRIYVLARAKEPEADKAKADDKAK